MKLTSLLLIPLWISFNAFLFQSTYGQNFANNLFLSDDYLIRQWGIGEGLPVNSVYDILKTTDGYLWLTTHDGLVKFDGVDFEVYTSANYPGLPENRIQYIEELKDGGLIIRSESNNITHFRNEHFAHLLSIDPSKGGNGSGARFYKDNKGNVWLGGDDGIYVFREDSLEHVFDNLVSFSVFNVMLVTEKEIWFNSSDPVAIYRIIQNRLEPIVKLESSNTLSLSADEEGIWISTPSHILFFNNNQLDTVLTSTKLEFLSVTHEHDVGLHILTNNNGYYLFQNGKLISLSNIPQAMPSLFPPFRKITDDKFWTISKNGIFEEGEKILENPEFIISDIEKDEEDNIWVATTLNGLLRLKKKLFTTYSHSDGLTGRSIYPLFQSSDSSIWVGSFGEGFSKIKNGVVESGYTINGEKDFGLMQSFAESQDGTLLLSVHSKGIFYLTDSTKNTLKYPTPSILEEAQIYSLFFDSQNRLWVGSDPVSGGLYMQEGNQWNAISQNGLAPNTRVRSMLEAPNGDLFFTTQGNGIIRFDGYKYQVYDTSDGLTSQFPRAINITESATGQILWVGFEDKGIDRIELQHGAPNFEAHTNYQVKNGLFDNSIHVLVEDEKNRFWVNTNRGIFWVDINELDAFAKGEINVIYTRGYTEEDGLLNREGNGGIYPAGFKAMDGTIWFPTQNGIVTFHPDSIIGKTKIAPIVIQHLSSKSTPLVINKGQAHVPRTMRDLEIEYAMLSFSNSEKNQYRYILEGYEKNWNLVGNRTTAYYTNLPSGTYTFKIMGANNEGEWNTIPATLTLVIEPYIYETPIFWVINSMLLFSLAMGINWLRSRYFKKRELLLKREVNLRTKQFLEEKDKTALQAQELDQLRTRFFIDISHEIRTPLTLIIEPINQWLNGDIDPTSANGRTQRAMILRNSERLLRLIDQILHVSKIESSTFTISPQSVVIIPFLRNILAFYSEAIEAKNIRLFFESNLHTNTFSFDPDKIEKVIGNLLSNAIKFTPSGGKIAVQLNENEKELIITVSDTGIGIGVTEIPKIFDRFYQVGKKQAEITDGFGIGLSIAKELVELHRGTLTVDSELGKGTSFVLKFLKVREHLSHRENTGQPPNSTGDSAIITSDNSPEKSKSGRAFSVNHNTDKTTILIVDDHDDMRYFISERLSGIYAVTEAENGVLALESISANPPDLIIADVMMPEMDGMELNRKLKEIPETASIPFIFLTAKVEKQNKILGLKEGADYYLEKPFDAQELLVTVQNLLATRQRLRQKILANIHTNTVQNGHSKPSSNPDPFLQELYKVLEQEYSNPALSVNLIQEKMYMSRSSLYRAMSEKTGLNTQQFVTQFRLEKAKEMLTIDEGNISEIAYACGFNSLSYFSRSFKSRFGKSPSDYLKRNR